MKDPVLDRLRKNANGRRWRAKNRERMRAYERAYYEANKEHVRARQRELYRAKHPAKPAPTEDEKRAALLKRRETFKAYRRRKDGVVDAHGASKSGPCEICGASTDVLHLDHDHSSGRVRGWLCGNCNRALGLFRDNEMILRRAIKYLEKSSGKAKDRQSSGDIPGAQGDPVGSRIR